MATTPTQDQVRRALSRVIDPELRRPITDLGMVESVEIAEFQEGADDDAGDQPDQRATH